MKGRFAIAICALSIAGTAAAEEIKLKNGDTIVGTIVEQSEQTVVIDHPVLGRLVIPTSELEPAAPPPAGLFGTPLLAGWKRAISAGLSGSDDTSEQVDINGQLTMAVDGEHSRQDFLASYFYSHTDGETKTNRALAKYEQDRSIAETRFFYFGQAHYDYDQFQDWDHRISSAAGLGYELLERETVSLRGQLGGGFSQTFVGEEDFTPEGLAGLEFEWNPSEDQHLALGTTYYPDLSELSEYRLLSSAGWTIQLQLIDGLGFKLGATHEYLSSSDTNKNRLNYFANLTFSF
jgi:putative salt-induced outer membrane protein YdiY